MARALEVNPNVLHRWWREFRHGPGNALAGNGKQRWSDGRIAELEGKIGQQTVEIDFLKGCLQPIDEQRMLQALSGNPRSIARSKKKRRPTEPDDRAHGEAGPSQPVQLLPLRREPLDSA